MIIKEVVYSIKKYKIISLSFYILLTLLLILINSLFILTRSLLLEQDKMKTIYEDKAMLRIIDAYHEPKDFTNFLLKSDSLSRLKNFYRDLDKSDKLNYLSHFAQPVYINNTKLPEALGYGHENGYNTSVIIGDSGKEYMFVKAMQMNYDSYSYFNLDVESGRNFDMIDFEDDNTMNVILGAAYKGYYQLGDIISLCYYSEKSISVRVIGFLESSSKIYYQEKADHLLDNYIIMPYINYTNPEDMEEEKVQKRIYFAMINGYLITDNAEIKIQKVMNSVSLIAKEYNIKYTFLGLNRHLLSYQHVTNFLQENIELVYVLFFATSLIGIIL